MNPLRDNMNRLRRLRNTPFLPGSTALHRIRALIVLLTLIACAIPAPARAAEYVVVLHGLCKSRHSMSSMARALSREGYEVLNVSYPSRKMSVRELSDLVIGDALQRCATNRAARIHFVTHSLGGILVRDYCARHTITNLGHVVMLAPPNGGSEVIDKVSGMRLFAWIAGPAGPELGTSDDLPPRRLGPPNFSVGIIAGRHSVNWINSTILPGADDGKVTVASTRLDGMKDHVVVPASHPLISRNRQAIANTLHFLRHGRFLTDPSPPNPAASDTVASTSQP